MMTILRIVWTFLRGLPWVVWAALAGIVAAYLLIHAWDGHIRAEQKAADDAKLAQVTAQLNAAMQANASNDAAVQALQGKLKECEAGRVADLDVQRQAKAAYEAAIKAFKTDDAKTHAATQQRLATTCREIASQPTCVTGAM
jgi:type III secretory pathway component EscV